MSGNDAHTLEVILERMAEKEYDELEKRLISFCKEALDSAVQFRFSAPGAHNFTGNLVGSIAVGLWRRGKFVAGFVPGAANNVERVRHRKMTAPRKYFFEEDYDTVANTVYKAEVATNQGYGQDDAKAFLSSFKADSKAIFHVAIAYTTEYAGWVETQRHTTGYMETVDWVELNARQLTS